MRSTTKSKKVNKKVKKPTYQPPQKAHRILKIPLYFYLILFNSFSRLPMTDKQRRNSALGLICFRETAIESKNKAIHIYVESKIVY